MSVGQVTVGRGRTVVVAVVAGAVTTGIGVVGTVVCSGKVAAVRGATVVFGDSLSSRWGAVVVVAADEEPEPEPELDEDEPDEATDETGARLRPDRSGAFSGGVSSGGLALDMKRLNMSAGSDPPLTLVTPWTL
jgi:hypothetical protein